MALKLDNSLLEELGLGALPEQEKQLLLRQIYEKLEMNVGMRLADQMSNEQLDAFERFVEANDDKGAFQWLEQNFPNYKDVVNQEFEKLKAEIRSVAPQILASAQQNAQNPQNPQAPQGTQPAQMQPGPQGQQPTGSPYGQSAYGPQQPAPGQFAAPQQPQPSYGQPVPRPAAPQPQYQPQPSPAQNPGQMPGAVPQSGHLQPQYGPGGAQPSYGAPQPQPGQPQSPPPAHQQPGQPQQYPPFPPAQPQQ